MSYKKKENDGVALILILWVLILLDIIVIQFVTTMRTEVDITMNYRDSLKAYYYANAAMEVAKYEIMYVATVSRTHMEDPNGGLDTRPLEHKEETGPKWNRKIEMDDGTASYEITGYDAKLDLNTLARNKAKLEELLANCGEEYGTGTEYDTEERRIIVYSIMDWVDPDDLYSAPGQGAEDDWYEDNPHPAGIIYECKDDRFYSVEELELIRGLRPEEGESEDDEIATRKRGLLKCLYNLVDAHPTLVFPGINQNYSNYAVTKFIFGEDKADEIFEQRNDGEAPLVNRKISIFEVTATGTLKGSVVESKISAEFDGRRGRNRIDLLRWIDNYVPLKEIDSNDQLYGSGEFF